MKTDIQTSRHTIRPTDRCTGRSKTDIQTDIQKDIQTGRIKTVVRKQTDQPARSHGVMVRRLSSGMVGHRFKSLFSLKIGRAHV